MTRRQYVFALLILAVSGLVGGGLAGGLFSGHARAADPGIVTAREVRIVDDRGRTRMLFSVIREKPRAVLLDPSGEFRMELGLGETGEPRVGLLDAAGRVRAEMALSPSGAPRIALSDVDKVERAVFRLGEKGAPGLLFRDHKGGDRLALWQESDETGLALADGKGRPRAGFTLRKNDQPHLAVYGADGRLVWQAGSGP